ncbi:hypothetical protein ISN44_As13g009490 [Arabidopsis suecica]|uniref:Uncharacterized protein n=1 Tax=Arabidopsis suecica TaxID=45249 RepID=A0A8T1XQU1_ARASU|nr:hypothetical protein ISN44_As13g009490 [Arabidopsis suecica]
MGSTVKKASKEFYQPMFQNVSQKHMRECTLVSLDWWLDIVHIDKTISRLDDEGDSDS